MIEQKSFSVSIIICARCTYRYGDLIEAVASLEAQSYKELEIILVIDGNQELYEKVKYIESDKRIQVIFSHEILGLSESRNRGIAIAKGDVIAFLDDDAIADEAWIEELVKIYMEQSAISVGGCILPLWMTPEPKFLPPELYWLIGATYNGFSEERSEVRNTFGSNLSFRSDVLKMLGGFKNGLGLKGKLLLQGEEAEICIRMNRIFGRNVFYNKNAIVYHKVFPERLTARSLLCRAFWQGYSKRIMKELGYSLSEEERFLRIMQEYILRRLRRRSFPAYFQLTFPLMLISVVGFGYAFRAITSPFQAP